MDPTELEDRLLDFAVRTGTMVEDLPNTRLGRHIAGQLVRSGTSAAPNYEEACAAESRREFIHKLSICHKELRESRCWLRLIYKAQLLKSDQVRDLLGECEQLGRIMSSSILTAKSKK